MSLELAGVSKTFFGQTVLRGVDLSLAYGEIHALVGQNGSGKSTLIKILSGYHEPDLGATAQLDGRSLRLGSAQAARDAGLRFVHQDLGLVHSMSALENMWLGRQYPVGFAGHIRWREAAKTAQKYLDQLGVDIDVRAPVMTLTASEQSILAIARALSDDDEGRQLILVLDEPTAALPADEVDKLLNVLVLLREGGNGVLLVSHHLSEVLRVADRITVLRDGLKVASVTTAEIDHDRLTELIVGSPVVATRAAKGGPTSFAHKAGAVLRVEGLAGARLNGVDLEVQAGEVVGVAGITGSGRESLATLLMGIRPRSGNVYIDGDLLPPGDPRLALARGMVEVPGERARYGLFANLSVLSNMTISDLRRHRRWGRISARTERAEVRDWIEQLSIVTRSCDAPILSLSGGNQQKVLFGRALRITPKILVLDDATQGIDVGARAQIHEIIARNVTEGMAVLMISTDSDELARLSNRVLVMAHGRIAQCIEQGEELTVEAIDASQLAMSK